MKTLPYNATSRDLLVYFGGEEHDLHTVLCKTQIKGKICFHCTCGEVFEISSTEENRNALRNVPEEAV